LLSNRVEIIICSQVEAFVKAAQKVGRGLSSIFKKKSASTAGAPIGLDDLLQYSNVSNWTMAQWEIAWLLTCASFYRNLSLLLS
jgi:hypothetical protein